MKEIIRRSRIFIYVLELEEGKYYVGQTISVDIRFKEHLIGKGANFTKEYKPIRVVKTYNTKTRNNLKAFLYENFITLLFMERYGCRNVKGGQFLRFFDEIKLNSLSSSLVQKIKIAKKKIRTTDLKY